MSEMLPSTGDAVLDFALEAGPRALHTLPREERLAIAKSLRLGPWKEACRLMAAAEIAEMYREIATVSALIAAIDWKATRTHIPYCKIPVSVNLKMRDLYGEDCWQDHDFLEDFLDHHPGLRVQVKRGMRGQEY